MARAARKTVDYKSRAQARADIIKTYGEGAIISLEGDVSAKVNIIPTGAILVDLATMVGGFPRGRLTEIYGAPSSGKTSITTKAAANCQKAGGHVLYLDYEHAFDGAYARKLGLSLKAEDFTLAQPDDLETGFEIARRYLENDMADMIVFDSLAAMEPREVLDAPFGQKEMPIKAKMTSQSIKKIIPIIHRSDTAVVFINHMMEEIGGISFGPPKKTTPGGKALKFYASLRMEVAVIQSAKGRARSVLTGEWEEVNVAVKAQITMVKNKLGSPYKRGTFYMRHGRGISRIMSAIEIGLSRGLIKKNGARIYLPEFGLGLGAQNLPSTEEAIKWLEKNDPDEVFCQVINSHFMEILKQEMAAAPSEKPETEVELDDDDEEGDMMDNGQPATVGDSDAQEPVSPFSGDDEALSVVG